MVKNTEWDFCKTSEQHACSGMESVMSHELTRLEATCSIANVRAIGGRRLAFCHKLGGNIVSV